MNKSKIKSLISLGGLITLIVLSTFVLPSEAFAVTYEPTEYNLLAPIPLDRPDVVDPSTNTKEFIPGLVRLMIAIAGGLAVIKLIWAGIQYMSTDAWNEKSDAKETIKNALWGLMLAISAWLIVFTINPKLVQFNLDITPQEIGAEIPPPSEEPGGGGGGILPGYTLTQAQVKQDADIRVKLASHKPNAVGVNNPPCATGNTQGCTNVVGLPESAITSITHLSTACRCDVMISGGTEGGHSDHGPGLAVYDLRPNTNLNNYLARNNPEAKNPVDKTQVRIGSVVYTFEKAGANGRANADHWHVELK